MPRTRAADTQYLEKKDGKFRVVVSVPRSLHREFGTKLKRSLKTDSLSVANTLKWQVVLQLKAQIAAAQRRGGKDPLAREALTIASLRETAGSHEDLDDIEYAVRIRADEIAGPIVETIHHSDGTVEEVHEPGRLEQARAFVAMASGSATPLAHHHAAYLRQLTVKPRTLADDERALRYLEDWCSTNRVSPTLQTITRKVARRFADGLGTISAGKSNVTLQKYVNRLRVYWQWLLEREHVETNVWVGIKLKKPEVAHNEEERPFTKAEMLKLLDGLAKPQMHDLMRIAALTGARLDAIVDLRVQDCEGGVFLFKPQKKEKGVRAVPIHSALTEIVERRLKGQEPDAPFFPEWPAPRANSKRERSFKASNDFTTYRRGVGVDEMIPGKRRSLVNFHSFRRWFITEAERGDQPESMIAAVVGHKRSGITLGRYSAGPLLEQARRCVEAIALPTSERELSSGGKN